MPQSCPLTSTPTSDIQDKHKQKFFFFFFLINHDKDKVYGLEEISGQTGNSF
jgi:hypothetical protein